MKMQRMKRRIVAMQWPTQSKCCQTRSLIMYYSLIYPCRMSRSPSNKVSVMPKVINKPITFSLETLIFNSVLQVEGQTCLSNKRTLIPDSKVNLQIFIRLNRCILFILEKSSDPHIPVISSKLMRKWILWIK